MKILSFAPGKVILFGEHFVVYQKKGLVAAIEPYNKCVLTFKKSKDYSFKYKSDQGFFFVVNKTKTSEHFLAKFYLRLLEDFQELKKFSIFFEIKKSWPIKGVGNSSAIAACFFLSIMKMLNKKVSKQKLLYYVQESDKIAHGRPSGIDANAITFGNMLEFQKNKKPKIFSFSLKKGYEFILVSTSKKDKKISSTKKQIETFAKNLNPAMLEDYKKIFRQAKKALKSSDINKIAQLMNANHELLKKAKVSSKSIEKVREILLKNNCLGSKLTGAGGKGGGLIALIKIKDYKKIKKQLQKNGFEVYRFKIAKKGAHVC